MTDRWQPLVELARSHARERADDVDTLVAGLLGDPWRDAGRARSILNHDGVPLQLCWSSDARGTAVRLIGDPHTAIVDVERRTTAAAASARALGAARDAHELAPLVDATLASTLPPAGARHALRDGSVWLAAAVDGRPGLAIYTTLAWLDGDAAWPRVDAWLDAVLPDGATARAFLAPLVGRTRPVSASIEGRGRRDARAKLYLRLERPGPLEALGVDELAAATFGRFLERAQEGRTLPRTGLVISVGFAIATGAVVDVKVDVCGHCIPRPRAAWAELLRWIADEFGLEPIELAPALARGDLDVAFVGLGRRVGGDARCNVYLRACA